MQFNYVVYKITFPNGKIYIGKDIGGSGHSLRYFGSWDNQTVAADFTKEQLSKFTLTKEILFESVDKDKVSKKELELIKAYNSNQPDIGYNRT
ncbi:MAG TPA: GIY-YIG nuclease family protein [Alphaproteobacteria bacterium]|nr:hypothetical protein [Rhodospirillaceae bacterium]HRJ66256.1 GIY-YIG nuclease family protein [Alphaproteobacteria bacterium]